MLQKRRLWLRVVSRNSHAQERSAQVRTRAMSAEVKSSTAARTTGVRIGSATYSVPASSVVSSSLGACSQFSDTLLVRRPLSRMRENVSRTCALTIARSAGAGRPVAAAASITRYNASRSSSARPSAARAAAGRPAAARRRRAAPARGRMPRASAHATRSPNVRRCSSGAPPRLPTVFVKSIASWPPQKSKV